MSLHNELYGRMVIGQPEPEIGMGASILSYSDRHAASVIEIAEKYRVGGKGSYASLAEAKLAAQALFERKGVVVGIERAEIVIAVQRDHAKRVDDNGMSESQEYEFSPNPKGMIDHFRKAKDGRWEQVCRSQKGHWRKSGGYGLRLGERLAYHDFSF
jgi:hypothetical protein